MPFFALTPLSNETEVHRGFLGGQPEGRRPLERRRRRWKDNIKINFQVVG